MDWQNLFEVLGTYAIVVAGAAFVLKRYFELLINKDLEVFKQHLINESLMFKVTYEKLHTERTLVIKELYQKLVQTHTAFNVVMAPMQNTNSAETKKQNKLCVIATGNILRDYFEINKIYLEKDLADELEDLIQKYEELWIDWECQVDFPGTPPLEKFTEWQRVWKTLNQEIALTKTTLEEKFRSIIGIK